MITVESQEKLPLKNGKALAVTIHCENGDTKFEIGDGVHVIVACLQEEPAEEGQEEKRGISEVLVSGSNDALGVLLDHLLAHNPNILAAALNHKIQRLAKSAPRVVIPGPGITH